MLMDVENNIATEGKPSGILVKHRQCRQILGTISNGLVDNSTTNKGAIVKSKTDICKLKEKIQPDPTDEKFADFQQKSVLINNEYGRNIGNFFKLMMISSNKNTLKMLSDAIKEFGIDYIINFTDENGDSLCSLACANGQLDIIRYLVVEMGVNILQVSSNQKHPLHVACSHGQTNVVRFLCLILSTNPDIRDKKGNTPLHIASAHGYLDVVRFLIEKMDALSVLLLNQDDETPITLAEKNHHPHISEYLNQIKDSVVEKHEMMTNNPTDANNNNSICGEEEESYYSFTTDVTERSELAKDDRDSDQGENGRLHASDEMTPTFSGMPQSSEGGYEGADDSLGMIIYDLHDELKLMMNDNSRSLTTTMTMTETTYSQLASLSGGSCRDDHYIDILRSRSEKDIDREVHFDQSSCSSTSSPNSLTVHGADSNDSLLENSQLSEEDLEEELKGLIEDQSIPLQQLLPYSSYANNLLSEFFSDSTEYNRSDMSDLTSTNTSIERKEDEEEEENEGANNAVGNGNVESSLVVAQEVDETWDTSPNCHRNSETGDDFPVIPGGRTGRVRMDEDEDEERDKDQEVLDALKQHLRNSLIEMDIYVQQKYSNFSEQSAISDAVDGLPLLHTSASSDSTSSSALTPKTNRSLKDLSFGSKASARGEGFHRPKILSPILSPLSPSTDDCQLSPEPSSSILQEDWNSFSLDQHVALAMAESPLRSSVSGNEKNESVISENDLEDSFQANCIVS